jgi:hypothetical protein
MKDKFPKPTPDVGPAIRTGEANAAAATEGLTSSSSLAAARALLYVNRPGPEDVLLGRGAPIIKYLGNVKFRAVVKSQKKAYQSTRRHSDKKAIAEDVIQIITSRNGRFLQRVKRGGSTVSEEEEADDEEVEPSELLRSVWKIADEDAVLEKVKQALRDKDGFGARSCKAQQVVPRLKNAAAAAANKQASPMMNHHPDNLDGLLRLQQMMSSYPLSHRLIQASMIEESSRSALNNNNNHGDHLLAPPFLPSMQQQLQQMEQLRGLPDSTLLSLMIAAAGHRQPWQLSPPPSETILHSLLEAQGHRSSSLLADYHHNRHNNEYVMRMMMMLQRQQQQQHQQHHLPEANEEEQIMARARLALGN